MNKAGIAQMIARNSPPYWARHAVSLFFSALLFAALPVVAAPRSISREAFLDKLKGAWAGQAIGVCYGAPYEFQSNGKPITADLEGWRAERLDGAIHQDDLYVEMTFLQSLEKHGLDITPEQAGRDFGDSKYDLWHANRAARDNIRRGILPPASGSRAHNPHYDDIDFQIEADLFGILCPGMPQEAVRLGNLFGRIMNDDDGLYGGLFIAGMYTAAYFEDQDIEKVIRAGLDCIPAESTYRQCIADVLAWHREHPTDWLAAWHKIEAKWQDDDDCAPGEAFNIDAKLNGAYVVMGLLYGNGDLARTLEIATRCGQDADCNPSSAAGILGCMKGFAALGKQWTDGISRIADTNFAYTQYSWNTLIPACQRMTEAILLRKGGRVGATHYRLPRE